MKTVTRRSIHGPARRTWLGHAPNTGYKLVHGEARGNISWPGRLDYKAIFRLWMEEGVYEQQSYLDRSRQGWVAPDWEREWSGHEWVLRDVPLDDIVIPQTIGSMDRAKIERYAKVDPRRMPPLILDLGHRIINGRHRLMAAFLRGEKTVRAYVPVPNHPTPVKGRFQA